MALEKKNISFPFLKGRNSTPGEKAQVFGELQVAKNLICENTGDLKCRTGFTQEGNSVPLLPNRQSAGSVTQGSELIASGDEVIVLDKEIPNAYAKGKDDLWIKKGKIRACDHYESPLSNEPSGTSGKPAFVSSNGMELHVWVEQPYQREPFASPNTSLDEYKLKPAALYYMIKGKDTGSTIIPKTKLEDAELELRCAGRWTVVGTNTVPGSKVGSLESEPGGSIPAVDQEILQGNICVLKHDSVSATGRPSSELGTQEANPCTLLGPPPPFPSGKVATVPWEWKKYTKLGNASLFADYTKGVNTNYYQMKPQLFLCDSGNYAVLVYANGENPAAGPGAYDVSGKWKVFYRTIDLSDSWFNGEFSSRADLPGATLGSFDEIVLSRQAPSWDADYCLDPTDSPTINALGNETDYLGFAIVSETPRSSNQWAGPDGKVIMRTYRAQPIIGGIGVTRRQSVNVTDDVNASLGLLRTAFKSSSNLEYGGVKTWTSQIRDIYGNPVASSLVLKGMNKLDRSATKNRYISDPFNYLTLFVDMHPATGKPAGIFAVSISTQGLPTPWAPLGGSVVVPLFDGSDAYEDILPVNAHLVDAAVASSESVRGPNDFGPESLIEVVWPESGHYHRNADDSGGPTQCQSWLVQKQPFKKRQVIDFNENPKILCRSAGIVSDGFRSPFITGANDREALFLITYSGPPIDGSKLDNGGRICLMDYEGRILSSWAPLVYSSTASSEQFGSIYLGKFNNNTSLRGLRSRICYSSDIPQTSIRCGSNNFDSQIFNASYKWMLPTSVTIDLDPPKPFQNTSSEGSTYIASGLLWKYDGESLFENEFLTKPFARYTGPSPTVNGTYSTATASDTNLKLLLHCDGVAGGTAFPDGSSFSNTITAQGSADTQTATPAPKFGTASANFDGATGYLSGVSNADYQFGSGSFTIDMWVYPTALSATYETLFCINGVAAAGKQIIIDIRSTDLLVTYYDTAGTQSTVTFSFQATNMIANDVWQHIALVRNDLQLVAYLDGLTIDTATLDPFPMNAGNEDPLIGARRNDLGNVDQRFTGRIDEFRIVKGVAEFVGEFTPPTVPYEDVRAIVTFTPRGGLEAGLYSYYFNYYWLDANNQGHYSWIVKLFGVGHYFAVNMAPNFIIFGNPITNHRDNMGGDFPDNNYPTNSVIQVWRTPKDLINDAPSLVGVIDMSENKAHYEFTDDPLELEGDLPGISSDLNQTITTLETDVPYNDQSRLKVSPESPLGICLHRGHLVVSTTRKTIYSSLARRVGITQSFNSPGNNDNSYTFSPGTDDRISHVASTGNTLYCFTPNNVFAYFGDGPGFVSDGPYEGPEVAGPSMGILPSGFTAKIPDGVIYQGQGGFYLLQGKGRPVYFGANVSDYEGFPVSNVAVSDENQHILIAMGGDYLQGGGTILVYNWVFNIWTTWDLRDATIPQPLVGIDNNVDDDGVNRLYVLTGDGRVWKQKDESYTDPNSWKDTDSAGNHISYDMELATTWVQLPEFHGQFRVYQSNLIARILTNPAFITQSATITAKLYSDWSNEVRSTHTLVVNPIVTPSQLGSPLEMGIRPTVQKCKSFAMSIKVDNFDAAPPTLQGVAFLVALRGAKSAFETAEVLEGTVT